MDPLSSVRDRVRDYFGDDDTSEPAAASGSPPKLAPTEPPGYDAAPLAMPHFASMAEVDTARAGPERAAGTPGALYTTSPNERGAVTTPTDPGVLVDKLRARRPELTAAGARTLAAQVAVETGSGRTQRERLGQRAAPLPRAHVGGRDP
jgi:hypothetical protein